MAQIIGLEKVKSIITEPAKRQKLLIFFMILIFFIGSWIMYKSYFKPAVKISLDLIQPFEEEIGKVSLNLQVLKNEKYQNLELYFKPIKPSEAIKNNNPFAQAR